MCGRYSLAIPGDVVARHFRLEAVPGLAPRFNIAPGQEAPIVVAAPGRRLASARWGLVPRWAASPASGPRPINARAESAAAKPTFADSFRRRRCLVPADGFYEWQELGARRQPFYYQLRAGGLMAFAGLWDRWRGAAENLISFTILTISANELVGKVHDRMPVILPPALYASWLDAGAEPPALSAFPAAGMNSWAVSTFVSHPANDSPRCVEPVEDRPPEQLSWLTD